MSADGVTSYPDPKKDKAVSMSEKEEHEEEEHVALQQAYTAVVDFVIRNLVAAVVELCAPRFEGPPIPVTPFFLQKAYVTRMNNRYWHACHAAKDSPEKSEVHALFNSSAIFHHVTCILNLTVDEVATPLMHRLQSSHLQALEAKRNAATEDLKSVAEAIFLDLLVRWVKEDGLARAVPCRKSECAHKPYTGQTFRDLALVRDITVEKTREGKHHVPIFVSPLHGDGIHRRPYVHALVSRAQTPSATGVATATEDKTAALTPLATTRLNAGHVTHVLQLFDVPSQRVKTETRCLATGCVMDANRYLRVAYGNGRDFLVYELPYCIESQHAARVLAIDVPSSLGIETYKRVSVAAPQCASCGRTAQKIHDATTSGGDVALKRCSACKKVHYCNAFCQRDHWSVHKHECIVTPAYDAAN